jgi:superfamily II DNA or RNA helicase
MGEYVTAEIESAIDKPTITGSAMDSYRKLAYGTRAICYCCSIKHSEHVAEQFNANGIPAAHIDG